MNRASGILMPVFSLPSDHGIGTLGREAYRFADLLAEAGQRYWQVLPLNPTSYGDSPYQSFSSYAGNPYFIDLDLLIEDGLLTKKEVVSCDFGSDPNHIDYGKLYENRFPLLHLAYERGFKKSEKEIENFIDQNRQWLMPYATYMALKKANGMKAWTKWEIKEFDSSMEEDRKFFIYLQVLFFKQWDKLREYVHSLGIRIIGDVPIYVAMDSADVWSEPEQFRLFRDGEPTFVAGVPPDYFSKDGQLWGNPLYDYERMASDGFGWWIRRIDGASRMYDLIRIDHFRGFASYYRVPEGAKTAKDGHWKEGPGMKLVGTLKGWFPQVKFIAEDLGILSEDVGILLKESGLPGMKVLEFAFDGDESNTHLPHNHGQNQVVYTGTHDNSPLKLWQEEASPKAIRFAMRYLRVNSINDLADAIIAATMASTADTAIIPLQDWLGLGKGARINVPGTPAGNWTWRVTKKAISSRIIEKIREQTKLYGRLEEADSRETRSEIVVRGGQEL